jgi:hypothetical protein
MIEWGERLLYLAGVPPEKFEECLAWAFGSIDPNESIDELRQRWNSKHKDIFTVSKEDSPRAFVWSIGKAYMIHNHSQLIIAPRRFMGGNN